MCGAMGVDRVTGKPATIYTPPEDVVRFEVHTGSEELVKYAAELRDLGKQPAEILHLLLAIYSEEPPARKCRVCGCTDDNACPPTCWWVADDLCSSCADPPPEGLADRAIDVLKTSAP